MDFIDFHHPLFFILILTGVIFVMGGLIMKKHPPKTINGFYGYRTTKSMKNQDTWDFSQPFAAKKMIQYGWQICLLSLIGLFNIVSYKATIYIALPVIIISAILMIWETESALKKKFDL